jgi:hypothetical protein
VRSSVSGSEYFVFYFFSFTFWHFLGKRQNSPGLTSDEGVGLSLSKRRHFQRCLKRRARGLRLSATSDSSSFVLFGPPTPSSSSRALPGSPVPSSSSRALPGPATPSSSSRALPSPPIPHSSSRALPGPPIPRSSSRALPSPLPGPLIPRSSSRALPGPLIPGSSSSTCNSHPAPAAHNSLPTNKTTDKELKLVAERKIKITFLFLKKICVYCWAMGEGKGVYAAHHLEGCQKNGAPNRFSSVYKNWRSEYNVAKGSCYSCGMPQTVFFFFFFFLRFPFSG